MGSSMRSQGHPSGQTTRVSPTLTKGPMGNPTTYAPCHDLNIGSDRDMGQGAPRDS
ncbi:hypothetical protein HAX54_042881, partial [Datura stramonium]|nr:hypothetical protein [Datura stramonium]